MTHQIVYLKQVPYLVVDLFCFRCGRAFRPGERVRVVCAAPVDQVKEFPVPGKQRERALLSVAKVNQFTEHENIDHCTEPR